MKKLSEILRSEISKRVEETGNRRAVARELGVDHVQLARFLAEERGLTLDTVDTLVASLGLTIVPAKKRKRP